MDPKICGTILYFPDQVFLVIPRRIARSANFQTVPHADDNTPCDKLLLKNVSRAPRHFFPRKLGATKAGDRYSRERFEIAKLGPTFEIVNTDVRSDERYHHRGV